MKIQGTTISMIRGDSEKIIVSCKDSKGDQIKFVTGDKIYFTVKEDPTKSEIMLQKIVTTFTTDGKAEIIIDPIDTKHLKFKSYVYDIQFTKVDGTVKTIIEPSIIKIRGEVTHD